jgi:arsenate reductase (thioredoxin)
MKTVIFACVHSAGRSQMAAGWFNKLADPEKARALAAGTQPAENVHPVVVDAMKEVGVDLSGAKPQLLTGKIVAETSCLVTMGCGESCPVAPHSVRRMDWELEDPKGQPIERVRKIRDDIKRRVVQLIDENEWEKM